jgi:hypothetical protein
MCQRHIFHRVRSLEPHRRECCKVKAKGQLRTVPTREGKGTHGLVEEFAAPIIPALGELDRHVRREDWGKERISSVVSCCLLRPRFTLISLEKRKKTLKGGRSAPPALECRLRRRRELGSAQESDEIPPRRKLKCTHE